jgi:hypothetical protein
MVPPYSCQTFQFAFGMHNTKPDSFHTPLNKEQEEPCSLQDHKNHIRFWRKE